MKTYFKLISPKTKLKCIVIIALAFASSYLASTWPVKLGQLYNDISGGNIKSISQGIVAVMTFGLIYLSAECLTIFRRISMDFVIADHEAETRENFIEKLFKISGAYFDDKHSGEINAQINQGINGLSQLIKMICNDIFATVLTAICTMIQVMLNAPLIMLGIMLLYLAITIMFSIRQIKSQNGVRVDIIEQKTSLEGMICQAISHLEMIHSMCSEMFEKLRLHPFIIKARDIEKKHHLYMGKFDAVKQVCKIIFQIIILLASVVLIAEGKMMPGAVISVCLLFQQLIKPIDDVYRFMDETASSVVKVKALTELAETRIDPIYEIKPNDKCPSEDSIKISNLTITNPKGNKIVAKYENLTIPCNKIIALTGSNGCGKTSFVRSLIRYYPHTNGTITIFGKNQDEYTQEELTSAIYYSPQVSFFIKGTVRENLTYGLNEEISDSILSEILFKFHLCGDYKGVIAPTASEALDTIINEKAEELSGGMKQRLALARAFLRKPKLFIFDEITANLDEAATTMVLDNIEEYAKHINAGIIYISHEANVVKRCDENIKLVNLASANNSITKIAA